MSLSGIAICTTALWSTIWDVSGHICRINAGQTLSTFLDCYSSSSLCISSVCFVQYTQVLATEISRGSVHTKTLYYMRCKRRYWAVRDWGRNWTFTFIFAFSKSEGDFQPNISFCSTGERNSYRFEQHEGERSFLSELRQAYLTCFDFDC